MSHKANRPVAASGQTLVTITDISDDAVSVREPVFESVGHFLRSQSR